MAHMLQENDRLKQERAQLRTELTRMSRVIQDLESQVAVSQDENANLSTGMEELDIQHQEAIEQIMVLKDSTQKRYEILQTEFDDMKEKYEEMVKLTKEREENKNLKHSDCQTSVDSPSDVKSQILINLSEEIKNMITTEIPSKYFETSKESASCLETVAAVEKMLSHTMARVDSSESKIRELLKELRNRDNDVEEIEEENKTLRLKIEELREKCDNLPTITENNEDVEVMENRIMTLENEISILREVRSNLEVEHSNSRSEIESLVRRLQTSEAMIRNQDNLQTEISKYKENEQELIKKLNDVEKYKEDLLSERVQFQQTMQQQEKLKSDLKESNIKLEELKNVNNQLQDEIEKIKDKELLLFQVSEELMQEKVLRMQLEEAKEKLLAELAKFESYEQHNDLQSTQTIKSQLEEENAQLKLTIAALQDATTEQYKLEETLQTQISLNKQLEESLDAHRAEVKRLKKDDETSKQLLEQQCLESDMKLKELKALNSCLTQKCVKFEQEIFDLSERLDSLKIEIDSKDRKLCEVILEQSVTNKELVEVKSIKDGLERQLNDLESQFSVKEDFLLHEFNNFLRKFSAVTSSSHIIASSYSNNDLQACMTEIGHRFEGLKEENSRLVQENLSLSDNVKSLIDELNDKSDCIFKLTAQMETVQAEKQSIEDRLRNLKETVSTGNQTDQPDGPQISQESYENIHKQLKDLETRYQELQEKYEKLLSTSELSLSHVNDQLRNLTNERQQLIEAVQTKHGECVKYHTEIQRLCAELTKVEQQRVMTTTQLTKQIQEKEEQLSSLQANSDRHVAAQSEQIHTLQNQLDYVSQLLRVTDRQEAEGQPASESSSAKILSDKNEAVQKESGRVDELYENLQQEQLRNKYLQDEVSEQHEKEASLIRELERLRSHLVLVEENYTQEMVRAERQVQELNQRLAVAEERAKSSSTAYTSASIRANQQVESLGSQMRLLSDQKEKLSAQLAVAEDKLHKQAAALTNLQIVLEQFQRDKERDVAMENERIRQTLQHANNKNAELSNEVKALQLQLKEAKEGLSAASRLTEQLDHKSRAITELRQEVVELTEKLKKADERIQAASVSVEGKVDRCLVRNLVVGYLCAPPSSQQQALGIIATVLDFTQEDRQRSGLDPNAKHSGLKQQSLSEAFIRFLENESRPQPQLRMPALFQESEGSRSRKTSVSEVGLPPARRISGSVLKDVLKQDI